MITLTPAQQIAYDLLCTTENVMLTGGGGVGKTAVLKEYISKNQFMYTIGVTSTTGASAILINGTTIHSYLGIQLGTLPVEMLYSNINTKRFLKSRWMKLEVLVIDEISMLDAVLFDKLEHLARLLRKSSRPFGGIKLILTGDFCQLSPIGSDKKFCFESESWERCIPKKNIIYLTEILRQTNIEFQKCLSEIRLGSVSDSTHELLEARIDVPLENEHNIIPTLLYSTNIMVDNTNEQKFRYIKSLSDKTYKYKLSTNLNDKIKDKYIKSVPAMETLELCTGCQVMLTYNLDIEKGLINGSRGIVVRFKMCMEYGIVIPVVKFINGLEVDITVNQWEIMEDTTILGTITQIPLKLGYAFSIHKSQGCSLDYVHVDLSNLFDYGMAYVALSRVRNLEGLSIGTSIDWANIKANPSAVDFYNSLKQ